MFDYVIVGAGTAGCVLAARLSENPKIRVLLLEAGGPDSHRNIRVPAAFPHLFHSEFDWAFFTEPEPHMNGRRMYWPRGKVLGGSSAMNAMIYIRGHRRDYDAWAACGNPGWSYAELLPHFLRSEDYAHGAGEYHGAGGPLRVEEQRAPHRLTHAFLEACEEAGIPRNPDFNGPEQEGAGLYQVTQRRGVRCSAAAAFLKPVLARKNLGVRTGAQALRVLFDGTQTVGVEYLHEGEAKVASCTREVLLCGGAVNSPQLLLLSGVGPAAQLEAHGIPVVAEVAGVGENLQDHLVVPVLCDTAHADTLDDAETFWNTLRYMTTRGGPMTSNLAEGGAFVRTEPELHAPDLQFHFVPGLWSETPSGKMTGHGVSLGVTQLRPASRGRIVLRSAEPLEPPAIEARYLTEEEDRATLLAGVRLARRILGARAIARHLAGERLPGCDAQSDSDLLAYIAAHAHTLYHPSGTCKMGPFSEQRLPDGSAIPGDPMAVVDAELRVRGTQGLRVADASIMPALVGGNTNAPVLAIAEKLAALLAHGSRT